MKKLLIPVGVLAFLLVFAAAPGRAEIFTANLTGAQEVPSAATTATGFARVVLDESAGTITYTVVFSGLSSAQTASHIHAPGAIGVSTGVAINFGAVGGTSGTITGSTSITPTQIAQLRQHLGYVNVHSSNFPGGEIRGQLGASRPVDNDGDGRTDLSVLRFPNIAPPGVAQITYWNRNSRGGLQTYDWGDANTDFPAPGDYDGDGVTDLAVYRAGATVGAQSTFYVLRSSDGTAFITAFGLNGDRTVARDYDGDGITDLAIWRPGATAGSQATWWIRRSTNPSNFLAVAFGITPDSTSTLGDTPIPGDYDGDGKFDIAVYRFGAASPSNSYIILQSSNGSVRFQQFGNFNTDYVLPGDYDGDGKCDLAIARTGANSTSPLVWWVLQSSTGTTRTQTFGFSNDTPVQGDYDGDARTDFAIYRPGATTGATGSFWIFRSFDATAGVIPWGIRGDFPVASFDAR